MEIEKQRNRIGGAQRWTALAGGALALGWGLRRRGYLGWPAAAAGAWYTVMGITGERNVLEYIGLTSPLDKSLPYGHGVKIRRSVTINRPIDQLYRYWRGFESLPQFMENLESVTVTGDRTSHWAATGPGGKRIEWDAEIIAERANELIGWRSTSGVVDHAGSVRFERAPGGRGTVVRVQIQYNPPGGRLGAKLARLSGSDVERMVGDGLMRFKQLMEGGEIPTTEGQPSARRERPGVVVPPKVRRPEPVQEASEESFPASDAPSWAGGGGGV